VWVDGDGPAIVLVHGSFGDHTAWAIPIEALRSTMTTFAMDRRGFGASDDGDEYAMEREFDDVAAVIDAVAARSGAPVVLWGHSYGANCAAGGAARTAHVNHLVLYEPSFGLRYPPGAIDAVEDALARGDRETAVRRVLCDILEMTDDDIESLRAGPRWPNLIAGAHTAPRECRAEEASTSPSGVFDKIRAPTLLLSGSESTPELRAITERVAAAIPGARIHVLDGHGHFAHRTDPAMVVDLIRQFVGG
jgi:pimeloyl-ACP methyl ester carboxylesterase